MHANVVQRESYVEQMWSPATHLHTYLAIYLSVRGVKRQGSRARYGQGGLYDIHPTNVKQQCRAGLSPLSTYQSQYERERKKTWRISTEKAFKRVILDWNWLIAALIHQDIKTNPIQSRGERARRWKIQDSQSLKNTTQILDVPSTKQKEHFPPINSPLVSPIPLHIS